VRYCDEIARVLIALGRTIEAEGMPKGTMIYTGR